MEHQNGVQSADDPKYLRALSLFEEGKVSEARQILESYLVAAPLNADGQNDLGAIYFIEGFAEKAIGRVCIALALDPKNASYRENFDEIVATLRKRDGGQKIRVAMFYDEEGWAWWIRSHAIKKSLPADMEVDILQFQAPFDSNQYDFFINL